MKKNEVEKLCFIPEEQLLDISDDVLEKIAAYNLIMLNVGDDMKYSEKDLEEKYQELKKRLQAEGLEV